MCSDFFNKAVPPDVYTDQVSCLGVLSLSPPFMFSFRGLHRVELSYTYICDDDSQVGGFRPDFSVYF